MNDELQSVKTFFDSYQLRLSPIWLQSCIEWCKEENLPPNYTIKDLQSKIYEQWLLLDLRDVEVPSLPNNLGHQTKHILQGNYSLQMMKVVDISKPKFWQLQRIRNNVSKNAEKDNESDFGNRCLQLTLTDGVQEVEAMEFKPVPALNLNATPGIKIRLMGPITVRRGRLMLESHNVKVLGGEVDDLMVPNAAENILARALKLPENPNPFIIQESFLTANKDIFNEENSTYVNRTTQQNQINHSNKNALSLNRPTSNANMQNIQTNTTAKVSGRNQFAISEEEERRIAEELELLMEMEGEFNKPNKKEPSKSPDMFAEHFQFDNNKGTKYSGSDPPVNNQNKPGPSSRNDFKNIPATKKEEKIDASLDDDCEDIFANIDLDEIDRNMKNHKPKAKEEETYIDKSLEDDEEIFASVDLDEIDQNIKHQPSSTQQPITANIKTIESLIKIKPNVTNGKFKIRAKFQGVAERLTVNDNSFHLVIEVKDSTGVLVAKVHNDIVTEFAGYRSSELMDLKKAIIENDDKNAKQTVTSALQKVSDRLIQINNILEVQLIKKEEHAIIVSIL